MAVSNFLKNQRWLCIAFALILAGSFMANLFHTSFHSVRVSRISFETERGTMTGILYVPRGASSASQRPAIALAHGYLNSAEMQDSFAIELSRRGFIVLAIDMYDHGNSRWTADIPLGTQMQTFLRWSLFDAVQFLYSHPYVARDANGNGLIGTSGHSMGGFSSFMSVFHDEMRSLETGNRMIAAVMNLAADFTFIPPLGGVPIPTMLAAFGDRPVGIIAEQYCEFFFTSPAYTALHGGSTQHVYWPATAMGRTFLGFDPEGPNAPSHQWVDVNSGELIVNDEVVRESQTGRRIVYSPAMIHPWAHFSATTTRQTLEFFTESFHAMGVVVPGSDLSPSNQIWQWKAFFNFITLLGYFLLIVPVMALLLKAPFLKQAITAKTDPVPSGDKGYQKLIYWVTIIVCVLLPMALYATLTERRLDNMTLLGNVLLLAGLAGFIFAIWAFIKQSKLADVGKDDSGLAQYKTWGFGGSVFAAACVVLFLVVANHRHFLTLGIFFVAPIPAVIAYWAVVIGGLVGLILLGFYFLSRKSLGATPANYGFAGGSAAVAASLLTALIGVSLMYVVLFIFHAIFTVDGRLWTTAIRVFTIEHFMVALRYAPFFFVFYFVNAVALNANTRGRKMGYLIAIALNSGGLIIWLALQYGLLFSRGVAWYPSMGMNGVQLFSIVPYMTVAAIFARKLYEKTNNVYLAAFTNTMLFTMIPIASTAVFWNLV